MQNQAQRLRFQVAVRRIIAESVKLPRENASNSPVRSVKIYHGMNFAYKNRIADNGLADKLSYMGAVLVRGPKTVSEFLEQ